MTVQKDSAYINIRQYWLPHNLVYVVPIKKGICLRPSEYTKLKEAASEMGNFVPELSSIVPCPYRLDHMNHLSFLSYPECNPYKYAVW